MNRNSMVKADWLYFVCKHVDETNTKIFYFIRLKNVNIGKMYWKIFHNLIKRLPGVKTVNKSYLRNYVRCSEKAEFNSDKGLSAEDKSDDNSEERLNKLLENSSPLKRLAEDSIWATSPYPKGTVFQDETDDKFAYTDVESLSVIMFPGQGTQYVGMGSDLLQYPIVQDMFASAGEVLGYNLLKLCLKGPAAKLNKTEYCQPAVMVCSLAALERLKDENPEAINRCVAACGYSVGEISALVFAGCLSFEKGKFLIIILFISIWYRYFQIKLFHFQLSVGDFS